MSTSPITLSSVFASSGTLTLTARGSDLSLSLCLARDNGRQIPIRRGCFNDSDSSPARDSGVAPLLFLLLLRTDLPLPPSLSLSLHVYSILTIDFKCPPCKISDIERILRCSSSPRRRSNIAWVIKAPDSVRRISVSHSDRCTCFHINLLLAQFVQIKGALLLKG